LILQDTDKSWSYEPLQVNSELKSVSDVQGTNLNQDQTSNVEATETTRRVRRACSFLNEVMGTRIQLDLDLTLTCLLTTHSLKVVEAPADGHCLLHAWVAATGSTYNCVKDVIVKEYIRNQSHYASYGIDQTELVQYLRDRCYTLNAADAIIDILCNGCQATAFIIGEKNINTSPGYPTIVSSVTEIRRITGSGMSSFQVLLLKTGEHYDSLA